MFLVVFLGLMGINGSVEISWSSLALNDLDGVLNVGSDAERANENENKAHD